MNHPKPKTREFKDTVKERFDTDAEFREVLTSEAQDALRQKIQKGVDDLKKGRFVEVSSAGELYDIIVESCSWRLEHTLISPRFFNV